MIKEYTNSQIAIVIDEYIHKKTHRELLNRGAFGLFFCFALHFLELQV